MSSKETRIMRSNRLAFIGLGAACIVAAGVGGYVASRQNATTPVTVSAATPSQPAATTAEKPVQETEAVVGDSTPKPAEVPPAAPPVSTKRTESSPKPSARTAKSSQTAPAQAPAPLKQSWPSNAPPEPNPLPEAAPQTPLPLPEPPRMPDPPAKTFEELVVTADSVIGLQTENTISSERARVEDRVDARVTRDVRVGDQVAIPAGTRAIGTVTQVERGGKFKERARLGLRFHTLVLADGTRIPVSTETIYREGDAPTSAQKIGGGAVAGTILGAILGGAKGAVIGGAAGAGAGAAATQAGDRSEAVFPAGTPMTVRILSPVTVTVEQNK
jgi:hypothetical protein